MDIKLRLVFSEKEKPYLLDISSLLYDFELLHDFSLILSAEEYYDYKFSRYFWYRKGRPIKAHHKIRAARIIKESPLTIELVLAGVGALWLLLQAMEKIHNWRLNREKRRWEVEKLRIETKIKEMELEQKVQERQASGILYPLIDRFERNPISLVDMDIEIIESDED